MTLRDNICDIIQQWHVCHTRDGISRFETLIQMPSGSILPIYFRPDGDQWIVSDGGAAIEESAAAGINSPIIGLNVRRAIRSRGLTFRDGQIESPAVDADRLQMAAVAVSNTSKEIAETLIYVGRDERELSLDSRARKILVGRFHSWVSAKPLMVQGKSEKQHKFSTCVGFA